MKVFNLKGFDNIANITFNDALSFASGFGFDRVNSAHLLYSLLDIKEIAAKFKSDTELTAGEYREEYMKFCRDTAPEDVGIGEVELGIEELSTELKMMITQALAKAAVSQKLVTVNDLYNEVIRSEDSNAWKFMESLGINRQKVLLSALDVLDNMPVTSRFAVNYNLLAKQGRFDPIEARDTEVDSVFEVMGRRFKNNPCLVGEAGVGKTAIVEGMAQRLIKGEVPHYLVGKQIISVDISAIVAGSKFRGDFEERLNGVLNEAAANRDTILFFDEMHMLSDAGSSSESSVNALNILKPAISHGDVQIIGATTPSEYKKFIENDKAFERRMQPVQVKEPTPEAAIKMVSAVIDKYNDFHNSKVTDGVINASVYLSDRYITDKKLPDKAISVIDETAARIKKKADKNEQIIITVNDIKQTVSKLTGIDVTDLDDSSRSKLASLEDRLKKHVISQDNAVRDISKAIRRSKAGVKDPNRPIGSFLFVGPTGVGKTELTKALAIEFSGGIKNMIRFDMSEFMEKHSVSKLIGSPPGYVGYGEGGQLTEAVRHNPYSIILFDEIEKAHPDVFNIMLQILDDGILTDSEGTRVDFKNTVIIMTSNAGYGANLMHKNSIGFASITSKDDESDKNESIALKALEETFRPEFLNRLDKVVIFNKLDKVDCNKIVEILLNQLKQRIAIKNISLDWDENLVSHISEIGFSDKYGARNLKRKIQEEIEDTLADMIINGDISDSDTVSMSYTSEIKFDVKHSIGKEIDLLKERKEVVEEGNLQHAN